MRIIQMLSTIAPGDAVSNDVVAMKDVIKSMGHETVIYAESIVPPLDKKTAIHIDEFTDNVDSDILILHLSTGSKLNFKFADYKGKKIMVYHNITPPEYFAPYDERFARICEYGYDGVKYLADKVDYVLAVSEYNKQDLLNMGYQCPIDVLPIIIPLKDYEKPVDKLIMKMYADDYTNILFTGRVAPNKKHENLIAAFYYYNRLYNPKSRLILAGSFRFEDPYYKRLVDYSVRLGMGDKLIFTGHAKFSHILAYYKLADVFLCLSEHEGFCVPLVEAMKFEVPIVAYGVAAVPSTMGNDGMILDDNDPLIVAAAIDKVVKDKKLNKRLIDLEKKRLKDFEYDIIATRFKKLLSEFISR